MKYKLFGYESEDLSPYAEIIQHNLLYGVVQEEETFGDKKWVK